MKDSCNGFDTRIDMETSKFPCPAAFKMMPSLSINVLAAGLKYMKFSPPFSKFDVKSPSIKNQSFHLGTHMKPIINSSEPFQYYHRLSGNTATTPHIAIDIDFENNLWRQMVLNDTDIINEWVASNSKIAKEKKLLPSLPKFSSVGERRLDHGSFSHLSPTDRHLRINGLDLSIADMHGFFTNCYLEPFLRVFNTSGLDNKQQKKMLDATWDNKPNERVVMRTASFGHGRQGITTCIKEGEVFNNRTSEMDPAMRDEMLVPFAIIAATRMRVREAGIRETGCSN